MDDSILIIGGGHAAAQLCAGLAEAGRGPGVSLVCEEAQLPYQRPPLSKAYLKNPDETAQLHRAEDWYAQAGITLHRGDPAVSIDRAARTVTLASGRVLPWHRLVLATGARARTLPGLPDSLANMLTLRSAADAQQLRTKLAAAHHVTVLGGGFIGLEIAATARALGKDVLVLESAPRLLARAVSPTLSAHVLSAHRAAGLDVRLGVATGGWRVEGDRLASFEVDGREQAVDLLVLGIGAAPETRLAEAAGLACADGVMVDAHMVTSDPAVLAIGDCTRYPDRRAGRALRLESVPNAQEQARSALATLVGTPRPHDALPWFWSDQGGLRLQMAGLLPLEGTPDLRTLTRPGANAAAFSLLHYVGAELRCVETANAPMDHMMLRKLMEAGRSPDPAVACDPKVALKTLLA